VETAKLVFTGSQRPAVPVGAAAETVETVEAA
jgi:hypothetical protein